MAFQPTIVMKNIEVCIGYEFEQEDCKICRGSLSAPPLQDLNNDTKTKIEMVVISGRCGHIFHKKCIQELKKNNYLSCPQCNLVWKDEDALSCDIGIAA
jgi:hypothetical protein